MVRMQHPLGTTNNVYSLQTSSGSFSISLLGTQMLSIVNNGLGGVRIKAYRAIMIMIIAICGVIINAMLALFMVSLFFV